MTKLKDCGWFCETGLDLQKRQRFPSLSGNKHYFCLSVFAACAAVRDTVCAFQSLTTISADLPLKGRGTGSGHPSLNQSDNSSARTAKKKRSGRPAPSWGGINYGSISEAALGILLEELIPGFSVREGQTFQLPLGQGRSVDFLINNTLVEFHFPRTFSRGNDLGDFRDAKERRSFLKALKRVGRNRHQRKKLLRTTHEQLILNYTLKRRRQIDLSLYGPHTELIVASTPEEFYWKVICRFAGFDTISESGFVERFNDCCRTVISSSKASWKQAA